VGVIVGSLFVGERFERGDDVVQVGLDVAQVLGQANLAARVGLCDEMQVGRRLSAVDL
jgi:hypothetical protein